MPESAAPAKSKSNAAHPSNANNERRLQLFIAAFAIVMMAVHLVWWGFAPQSLIFGWHGYDFPLLLALFIGGGPLVAGLLKKLVLGEFGSDLLAGISIVTSVILGEYLAGTLVVLMLSGGEALEGYALARASSALEALAKRMPNTAHRRDGEQMVDVSLDEIQIGDELVVFPHEVCPVDGVVLEGHSTMDESYLTGEPYDIDKSPGASVMSGAVNGRGSIVVTTAKHPKDSRFAQILRVMQDSQQRRPHMRRLADQLGAFYTPLALALAGIAWLMSGESTRFLAVLVVATPCPLLIAVPVAIIGAISLAARKGIIVRDPSILERMDRCKIAIFDKTGTLTYGRPELVEIRPNSGVARLHLLTLAASVERYSRHPLSHAIQAAAKKEGIATNVVTNLSEKPGEGLEGLVGNELVRIVGRKQFLTDFPDSESELPPKKSGMECIVLINSKYSGTFQFRDTPRSDSSPFVRHLGTRHKITRQILISGDRLSEVQDLAKAVGITEYFAEQSPEDKLRLVREFTKEAPTLFLGDGINDAPALSAATVGVAVGEHSDVTAEAAGAVILDHSMARVDQLLHISHRMRRFALQSAIGGMAASIIGMLFAAAGYLPPVAGALLQEAIDVVAVVAALRAAFEPKSLTDFEV